MKEREKKSTHLEKIELKSSGSERRVKYIEFVQESMRHLIDGSLSVYIKNPLLDIEFPLEST